MFPSESRPRMAPSSAQRLREGRLLSVPKGLPVEPDTLPTGTGITLVDERLEIFAANPDAPADSQRRQRALVDPVPHGLLVQLQHRSDLGDSEELVHAGNSRETARAANRRLADG